MHIGTAVIFQNPGAARPDHAVYTDDLALVDLAEPLGFESVWGVEHHFTDYTMCPDVLQYLTWIAARTRTVQLGAEKRRMRARISSAEERARLWPRVKRENPAYAEYETRTAREIPVVLLVL